MKSAYNSIWVHNLAVLKETKRWCKHGLLEQSQLATIVEAYKTPFYHPNFIIRILLFIATLLALSGVTGLLGLFISEMADEGIFLACAFYGLVSFIALEKIFIKNKHYKSGVTEALLYHAEGFTIAGVAGVTDFDVHVMLWTSLLVFAFSSVRYLDLLSTIAAVLAFAGILFYEFYILEGIFQQIIPFIFIVSFTPLYLILRKLKQRNTLTLWRNNLVIAESLSLLFIYAGGNYLVVRELSISLMGLQIEPGQDIPFAFLFYALTVIIPILYLVVGIKTKDIVLLRISLIVVAFSVFTFKYYYNFGHPEITLTIAGVILIGIAMALMHYLKTMRHGYTRENLLSEKWSSMNVEAFVVSQTMGGNQIEVADSKDMPGGGGFGGGGATTDF